MLLEPLMQAGEIRDIRIGLEVGWKPTMGSSTGMAAQEFDVLFTDGKRLFIIECKAGRVLNEDVYKLQNSVRNYGGVVAQGVLVSAFPPPPPPRRRLQSGKNLSHYAGVDVPKRLAQEVSALVLGARRAQPSPEQG